MRLFSLKTRRISAWVTTLALALSTFLPGGGLILSAQAASGLTWQASADTMDGTPNSWVRDLTQDSSGNLYAVAGDDKVYKSSDKGLNWSALTPGVGTSPTYYAVVKINSRLFVGGEDSGIAFYAYTADEIAWIMPTVLAPATAVQKFFVTSTDTLLVGVTNSSNGNVIWRDTDPLQAYPPGSELIPASTQPTVSTGIYDFAQISGGTLYAAGETASDGRVWSSGDDGDSWSAEYTSSAATLYAIEADSADNLYAGGEDADPSLSCSIFKKSGSWSAISVFDLMRQINDIVLDPSNRVFVAGIATSPPEPLKHALVIYSEDSGSNWYAGSEMPFPTNHQTKGAWAIIRDSSADNQFYVGVGYEGTPTVYNGDVHIGNFTSGGGGRRIDVTPPTSYVYSINGITDENDGNPGNDIVEAGAITTNPFTIKAKASDNVGIQGVDLYYRIGGKGNWDSVPMQRDPSDPNVMINEIWVLDFQAAQEGFYEFYSRATDYANNVEEDKKKAEGNGTVDLSAPYLTFTSPADKEIEVGSKEPIILTFSESMDKSSLQLELIKTEPEGGNWSWPLGWTASWRGEQQVTLDHSFEFSRGVTYTIEAQARDKSGRSLIKNKGVPNPWSFTIVPFQDPDLSNSKKDVSVFDKKDGKEKELASPGDILFYSLQIINDRGGNKHLKPPKDSRVIVEDILPEDVDKSSLLFYGNPPRGDVVLTETGFIWTIPFINEKEILPAFSFEVKLKSIVQHNPVINTVKISYWTEQFDEKKTTTILTPVPVLLDIDLSTSTFTASPSFADPGDIVTFTLTLKNTGATLADNLHLENPIPAGTSLSDPGNLIYNPEKNALTWQGQLLAGESKIFTFTLEIDADEGLRGKTIIDTAYLTNYDLEGEPNYFFYLSASVKIKPIFDVESTDPTDGAQGVPLYQTLKIIFTNNLRTNQEVDFSLTSEQLGVHIPELIPEIKDKTFSLLHPEDPFSLGATYTLTINWIMDEDGNVLSDFSFSFTSVAPQIVIVKPLGQTIRISQNIPQLFKVKLQDEISGQSYLTEKETTLRLFSTSPTATFAENEEGPFESEPSGNWMIKDLVLAKGTSQFNFYYQDSTVTPPPQEENAEWAGVMNPGPEPENDWYDDSRKIIVEGELPPPSEVSLVITSGPYTVPKDTFSDQFTVVKRDSEGTLVPFENGEKLYLATTSSTGKFYRYPIDEALLPGLLSNQSIDSSRIQVLRSSGGNEEYFYYKDSTPGNYKIFASLDSLIDDSDTFALLTVTKLEVLEEELEEELEEVEDESGRVLEKIILTPTLGKTLPEGIIKFEAQAYDTEGKEIENAIFAWFTINSGGTVLKTGLEDDSSVTLFTAGKNFGFFENTVLVATLYNDKVGSATASVAVVDLLALEAKTTLPSTGPNGLQWLLIAITLLAAVALAWVEHYEKTYLAESKS